jgi:low temperature requirement protein LtrA
MESAASRQQPGLPASGRREQSTGSVIPDIPYIRERDGTEQRATFFELFFDLVYVFAITQLSHHLLADLSWKGAAEMAFMLIAVYWAWNYTTWMANWFDPETIPVRLILVYVMLASLLMSVAIPQGFGDEALLFGCSYSALQIGRNAFVVGVTPAGDFNRNFKQILAWSILTAPLWVAGGLASDELRWVLWLAALGLDLVAPLVMFWIPRVGPTPIGQWQINGQHFAERFQLFVIIAIGESIVLTGVTASGTGLGGAHVVALGLAFLGSTALWWLYFGHVAGAVAETIGQSMAEEVGRMGRDVYTYLHLPIIAGIVLVAVGDELVVAHPDESLHMTGALVTLGGPALYLLGVMACAARVGRPQSWPRAVVVVLLLAAIPLAAQMPAIAVSAALILLLGSLVVTEEIRA